MERKHKVLHVLTNEIRSRAFLPRSFNTCSIPFVLKKLVHPSAQNQDIFNGDIARCPRCLQHMYRNLAVHAQSRNVSFLSAALLPLYIYISRLVSTKMDTRRPSKSIHRGHVTPRPLNRNALLVSTDGGNLPIRAAQLFGASQKISRRGASDTGLRWVTMRQKVES